MRLSKRNIIILLLILLILVVAVATVSAADTLVAVNLDSAIAAVDMQGAAGAIDGPISGTHHGLISPWEIDADSILI